MKVLHLYVKRLYKNDKYTIGKLYIEDSYICDTLEDTDRGLSDTMSLEQIKKIKVMNETAIPTGTYTVNMNTKTLKFKDKSWAKDFNGIVPRLENVKGYEGVLIHPGNYISDTSGCILVGENKTKGGLINSAITYKKIMQRLSATSDKIEITIQ